MESIRLPSSIKRIPIYNAAFLMFVDWKKLFPETSSETSSEPDFAKYSIVDAEIDDIEMMPGQDGTDTDIHEVVKLTQEELNDLHDKINQYVTTDTVPMVTSKQLTAICYEIYIVMEIIEALTEQKFENFINNPVVKLVSDRREQTDEEVEALFKTWLSEGFSLFEAVENFCKSFKGTKEQCELVTRFVNLVQFLEQIILSDMSVFYIY
jgi:hypothetical protein